LLCACAIACSSDIVVHFLSLRRYQRRADKYTISSLDLSPEGGAGPSRTRLLSS
jgi:hypothetical protein